MYAPSKRLQIGVSDFRHLIDYRGYFVDKTLFIKDIIDSSFQVMIIPRPRRFGKSLNLSMLKYYFDNREKETQALFKPFEIWQQGEKYTSEQGKRPVIHFSLKAGKSNNFEHSKESIFGEITRIYNEFYWLLETDVLTKGEKVIFEKIAKYQTNTAQYSIAIKNLSIFLHRHSGEQVLILLDEYDAAIHAGFYHKFYEEIIVLMKSILGHTFKDNPSLYKGVITGILRVAKESIFSDMNNPGIFTILNYEFADSFGFTEAEVKKMIAFFDLENDFPKVKEWYDGYQIGNFNDIYNPWSILNYVAKHREGFKSFWGNTSSDDLIKSSISEKNADEVRDEISKLLKGETIIRKIDENIIFPEFYTNPSVFWSLITFAGYLTPVRNVKKMFYELRIPNYEITNLFEEIVLEWLHKNLRIHEGTLWKMVQGLMNRNFAEFEENFHKVMGDTFSYFDTVTEPERVYQAYVLGLLGMCLDDFVIKSNRESGKGRYDILMLPREKEQYGILMEIKQAEKDAKKDKIDKLLEEALKQIQNNQYYQEFAAHEVAERLEIAIVFAGKEAHLAHQFTKG